MLLQMTLLIDFLQAFSLRIRLKPGEILVRKQGAFNESILLNLI